MKASNFAIFAISVTSTNAMYMKWLNVSRPDVPANYTGHVRPWHFAKGANVTKTVEPLKDLLSFVTSWPHNGGNEEQSAPSGLSYTEPSGTVTATPTPPRLGQLNELLPFGSAIQGIRADVEHARDEVTRNMMAFHDRVSLRKPWLKREDINEEGVEYKEPQKVNEEQIEFDGTGFTCSYKPPTLDPRNDEHSEKAEEAKLEKDSTTVTEKSKYLPS